MISLKGTFRVAKVLKKTKAAGYDQLEVGDIIELEAPVKNMGQRGNGGGGCYAQDISMSCEAKGIHNFTKSFNQTANTLNKFFELEEV
jgi:hypothetical protein